MEINDVLNEPEIKEMCTNAINKLEVDNEMYENLREILILIIGDACLSGETYSSLKLKYRDYCSVLDYLISVNTSAIESFSGLRNTLQDSIYYGSEIIPAYEAANRSVDYYDDAMQNALNAYNSYNGNPICPATLVAAAYSSYISYRNMKEEAEGRRDSYRNMIDYYDQIEANTRFAYEFAELISNNSVANSALQEISDSIVNGQYIPNTNAQWRLSIDNTVIDYEYYIRQFFVTGENNDYILDENGNRILDMNYLNWFFSADPSSINENLYIAFSYVLSTIDNNQINEILSCCIIGFPGRISDVFVNACAYYYSMSCINANCELLSIGEVYSESVNYNIQLSSALYAASQFASNSNVNNSIFGFITGLSYTVDGSNGYDIFRITVDSYEINWGSLGCGYSSTFDAHPWVDSTESLQTELENSMLSSIDSVVGNPVFSIVDSSLRTIIGSAVGMGNATSICIDTVITIGDYFERLNIRDALYESVSYMDIVRAFAMSGGLVACNTHDLVFGHEALLSNPIIDEEELIIRLACYNRRGGQHSDYTIDDLCNSLNEGGELAEAYTDWYCNPVNCGPEGSLECKTYKLELQSAYSRLLESHEGLVQAEFEQLDANQIMEIINYNDNPNYEVDLSQFEE